MNPRTKLRLRYFWSYLRGKPPWDSRVVPPEIQDWIEAVEAGGIAPGRALDLGCGTGTTALYLGAHGWETVGVDYMHLPIWEARRRARQHKLNQRVRFYVGDVTRLSFLPDHPPFDLAVDVGCLHNLDAEQQRSYASHLTRLLAPGATYLLYAFMPHLNRIGQPTGIDSEGLERLLHPAFELINFTLGQDSVAPIASGWYNLRRTDRSL